MALEMDWRTSTRMKVTVFSHHRQEERNTFIGEGHQPAPA
jgi:hypothetical protein